MTPAREREAQMRGKRAWVIPLVVLIGLLSLAPLLRFVAFTGRVTGERRSLVSPLNLTLAEDALIPLDLAPGRLTSLSVSGRVAGEASVWLDAGNVSYLIWESREPGLPGITGQVIEGEPSGAENTSTEESGQSPAQPSDETPDAEEANGSIPLETIPKAPADEPTDSLPGSEAENVSGNSSPMAEQGTPDAFPEAGVENLPDSADNASIVAETLIEPQADDPAETGENGSVAVENNNPAALPLREQCAETCQLPGTLSQGASLRIEVNGILVLEELQYTLAENQAPEFLFNGTLAMRETLDLNLSEFFSDPEGARLTFAALADTLDTSLTDDVLTLTAAPQTSGVHNVTLIASDGELSTRTELSIRVSPVEAANESVNATIEIHVPVRWLRTVDSSERLSLPRQAFNVSVDGEPYALAASDDILVDLADRSGIVQVEYYTPAPEAVEEELSPYRKLVTVSAELPYENVLAYTDITPSPAAAVRLFWLVNGSRLPHPAALLDADLDGLVERVEWMVPHLSNQTFEISITILNPVSYLRDGDTWTVYFNTTGVADLHINSTNANWTEMLSDLPDTVDEMTFLDIACGNVPLTDRLRIVDVSGTVWNFSALTPSVSLKPAQFLVENWSC
ncbi:hypothetical protein J4439_02490, partial [Candidatus Woesearchaeota archaeon]|nr:hypothetical protein [Candidatus Woesearchaeota archaeon]